MSKNIVQKLFILLYIVSILALTSFAGYEEGEESSSSEYYIELWENLAETDSPKKISYMSDGVAEVTTLKFDGSTLEMYGFHKAWKADPMSVKGKTYEAKIIFGEAAEGEATINEVGEGKEKSIGFDHKVKGTFKGKNGEEGVFSVSIMFIP